MLEYKKYSEYRTTTRSWKIGKGLKDIKGQQKISSIYLIGILKGKKIEWKEVIFEVNFLDFPRHIFIDIANWIYIKQKNI